MKHHSGHGEKEHDKVQVSSSVLTFDKHSISPLAHRVVRVFNIQQTKICPTSRSNDFGRRQQHLAESASESLFDNICDVSRLRSVLIDQVTHVVVCPMPCQ